jgi:hypothetical protein
VADEHAADHIWVTTKEGAEITGYNQDYLTTLARKISRQAEHERPIQIRNRSNRYEFWLPDLYKYIAEQGTGPQVHNRKPADE